MLSKKYLVIKRIFTEISKIKILHNKLIVLAKMYQDIDRGYRFSYVSDENGEVEFLDALSRHYDDRLVFFDVGSHFGNYTNDVISRFSSYEGHLFDLSSDTFARCQQRHGENKDLKLNNVAVTDFEGEVEYRFYPDVEEQNGISGVGPYTRHKFELKKARSITGDTYCAENNISRINLLKIDTEGYDLHVLKGFKRMLSEGRIDVIQFEYNIKSGETHSMLGDFYDYLEQYDYCVGPLRQTGVQFRAFDFSHNSFESGPNYIACKPELRNALAVFLSKFQKELRLNDNADLSITAQAIGSLEEDYSALKSIVLDIHKNKRNAQQLHDILAGFRRIGFREHKQVQGLKRDRYFLKKSEYYAPVEAERKRLGYWGQDQSAPRYSVCVCNYNMEDTLERALTSVLNQLDKDLFEVVVVDDGSSDNSLKKLENISQAYPNFRYISLPRDRNRHLGETRNISIRAARGEYILVHIDADDEWKPFLNDFVKIFHNIEKNVPHDFLLVGQQLGMAKRDFMLGYGPYDNIYRCEDRSMMRKMANDNALLFLDYRVYRTRLERPIKKKLFKNLWDDISHMTYDLRLDEPKWPHIKHALMMPFHKRKFSLASRIIRPLMILPVYVATRFMKPIENPISHEEMDDYHQKHRGTYPEVMKRLGGNPDISFLSEQSQEIYTHEVKMTGFRGSA